MINHTKTLVSGCDRKESTGNHTTVFHYCHLKNHNKEWRAKNPKYAQADFQTIFIISDIIGPKDHNFKQKTDNFLEMSNWVNECSVAHTGNIAH